ncbi:Ig-like domain-containing protein [Lawsonibacter celer]|uniref:Ig-like domain-containing protein n=1 Tax=Lawsonibacter celer TaxID=2986526 RepID=UPI001646E81B|nr:Ig-like domain-containing protein [Lawsonibacter celer]
MKHCSFLRRALPVAVLAAVLCTAGMPASALLSGGQNAAPAVSAFSKNGPITQEIAFTRADFRVEGDAALESVIVDRLPDAGAGVLTLGGQLLGEGDVVSMAAVDGLRFAPAAVPTSSTTDFVFTPVFSDGATGEPVTVGLYLLAGENSTPVAENLNMSTYKNVAITGQFAAVDPEGDLLTFQLVEKPARGSITMPEDGGNTFVYTPYENKTGKDSFTYVAVDTAGNASDPATVKIKIEKAKTTISYVDMTGDPAQKAAIRMAEEGILVGECMGGSYFFRPEEPVSRGEFVAMAMQAVGMSTLEGVERTGFADDLEIPTWAKPYASSALKAGLVQGAVTSDGQVVFRSTDAITRAEAAVLMDRALQVTDAVTTAQFADSAAAPAWALQSAANLNSCGVLPADSTGALGLENTLTRADAAELLCGALDLLETREDSGWFRW